MLRTILYRLPVPKSTSLRAPHLPLCLWPSHSIRNKFFHPTPRRQLPRLVPRQGQGQVHQQQERALPELPSFREEVARTMQEVPFAERVEKPRIRGQILFFLAGSCIAFSYAAFRTNFETAAVYGAVMLTALASPDSEVALFIPPSYSLNIQYCVGGLLLLDMIGVLRGWRYFDHFAHLGGAAFGVAYYAYGPAFWTNLRRAFDRTGTIFSFPTTPPVAS